MNMTTETIDGNIVLITVDGTLDEESTPKIRKEMKRALKSKPQALKIKLTEVPFMNSSGVAVLIEGMRWCKSKNVEYSLVGISESVRVALKVSRLLEVFQVEE